MVRVWRLFNPGMGAGYLPDPGGTLDQPQIIMEAFAVMTAYERSWKKHHGNAG